MKRVYKKRIRGNRDSSAYFYAAEYGQSLPGDKCAFYYVVRDHYSKLLTPFEAVEHPAAFMAIMRLDDNFRILKPDGKKLGEFDILNVIRCYVMEHLTARCFVK